MNKLPKIHDDEARRMIAEEAKEVLCKNVPPNLEALEVDLADARRIIDDTIKFIDSSKDGFNASMKSFLTDLRATRMTGINEVHQMLVVLKDIREFFVGRDYDVQTARLKDFVELCERLEGLKSRGTLDALADTMLKLAVNKS